MRALVQRVSSASVAVAGERIAAIGPGLVVLLGVAAGDDEASAERLARKLLALRLFDDGDSRMNLSLAEVGGEVLCVSQFTLLGDVTRGNRPSFVAAAAPEYAGAALRAGQSGARRPGRALRGPAWRSSS